MKVLLRRVISTGARSTLSSRVAEQVRVTNLYALCLGGVAVLSAGIFLSLGIETLSLLLLPVTMSYASVFALNAMGHRHVARMLLIGVLNLSIYTYSTAFGAHSGIHFWYFSAAALPFALFGFESLVCLLASAALPVVLLLFEWVSEFRYPIVPVVQLNAFASWLISVCSIVLSTPILLSVIYFSSEGASDAEKKSHDSLDLLRNHMKALDASSIVVHMDPSGMIIYANDKYCEVSGYSREELIGKVQELGGGMLSQEVWRGELRKPAKNGSEYWVATTITPILDTDEKIERYVSIGYDITQTKRNELVLLHSAKMASLGEMAGGIAHEINNPLTVVQGRATSLVKRIQSGNISPEETIHSLERIIRSSQKAAGIIQGLKSFSRNGENDPFEVIEINEVINSVFGLCTEKFRIPGIELKVSPVPDLVIECRRVQIEQVLLNLLQNAHDAVVQLVEKWVAVDVTVKDGVILILVTDSGLGIPAEVAEKLMHPFFTTKKVGEGTGLGLSISLGIVKDHRGRLRYDQTNPNTRFVVELPIKQAADALT